MNKSIVIIIFLYIAQLLISKTNEFSLEMIPIDSPDLNIVRSNLTRKERHILLGKISKLRASNIPNGSKGLRPNLYESQAFRFGAGYFVTKLAFGSYRGGQQYSAYFIIDTDSDETWVQCEGCNPCFQVQGSNFDYRRSRSFRRMSLQDNLCVPPMVEFDGTCGYTIAYVESSTTGLLGRDRFFFKNSMTGNIDVFPNIAFGCGLQNVNIDFWGVSGTQNAIAGVHGLAMGPRSFINQLSTQTEGRFSYCLPSSGRGRVAQSTIYFGADAQISGDVKMVSMYSVGVFHLYVSGISVNGERVDIDYLSYFTLDERHRTTGFFVDSAAPFSVLPQSAFNPFKMAMISYFYNNYGWQPSRSVEPFDLCYTNYPTDQQSFPIVTLHLLRTDYSEEIDMVLRSEHMFQSLNNRRRFCMAVIPGNDPGPCLLGAFQQKNFKFLFDVYSGKLYFSPQRCQEN